MGEFSIQLPLEGPVHSLTDIELENLRTEFNILKAKAESGIDLTLEEQRTIIRWMRADRETKFILASQGKKVKEPKEPKAPKPKKLKKLTKKEFNAILLKELANEELTEEEILRRDAYLETIN